jgi:uncharacterized protein YndB with AHSA1/START domain
MLKWIASGCLVIIVIVAGVSYYGYRQMSKVANQPPMTVSMAATPERVFASLANLDSLSTWRSSTPVVTPGRRGMLVVGDTLRERTRSDSTTPLDLWVVDSVVPNQLLGMRTLYSAGVPFTAIRRDVLVAAGDSTQVTTTMEIVLSDTLRSQARGAAGSVMGAATKMMASGMRVASERDLKRLKDRIEGRAVVRPDSAQ